MKTTKKSCATILFLVASVIFPVASAHAVSVELNLSATTIVVGQTLTLDVIINNAFDGLAPLEAVLAFGFDVLISNPSLISFVGATVTAPFEDDSAFFPDTEVAGSVFPGIPNDGTSNAIQLATLTFQALGVGGLSLGVVSDTRDPNEGLIYFLAGNVDITASTNINVVPEPATWLLLATGLTGLLAYGWRRQRGA